MEPNVLLNLFEFTELMLFALGSNGSGQLGLNHKDDVDTPATVESTKDSPVISSIATGGNHTLILFEDGSLRVSGVTGLVQSKITTKLEDKLRSEQVFTESFVIRDLGETWKLCSATWAASFLVTRDSKVFSFGEGPKGELGLGNEVTDAHVPTRIPGFPPPGLDIVDLSASMSHVVAVLSDGSVWGWGSGRKGQLGDTVSVQWTPRQFEKIPFRVEKAVCGREFTVVVGSSDGGEVLLFGSDKHGLRSNMPASVAGWKQVDATWGSVFVLKQNGELLAWGRNDHGQLGPDDRPILSRIAAGSEHVLALNEAHEALAWGWGEHGNCGTPTEQNGDVRDRFNVLQVPGRCRFIAAGCATTWIDCEGCA